MIEFVSQDEDMMGATFKDEEGEFHLDNVHIQQRGLVDVMREAMNAAVEGHGQPVMAQHDAAAEQGSGHPSNGAATTPVPAESPSLLGGYTKEWRWQVVTTPESTLVCVDNQPAIRAHDDATTPAPQLQKIVIPVEIVKAIAETT